MYSNGDNIDSHRSSLFYPDTLCLHHGLGVGSFLFIYLSIMTYDPCWLYTLFLFSAMIEDSRIYALREQYELPEDEPIPKDLLETTFEQLNDVE